MPIFRNIFVFRCYTTQLKRNPEICPPLAAVGGGMLSGVSWPLKYLCGRRGFCCRLLCEILLKVWPLSGLCLNQTAFVCRGLSVVQASQMIVGKVVALVGYFKAFANRRR